MTADLDGVEPPVWKRPAPDLVPDAPWEIVEPLLPPQTERPQGGGTQYVEDRAVFTAIVYVLTTGCAWRHLPGGPSATSAPPGCSPHSSPWPPP
jgi:Putative transposase of IS4/5 family (DUF4096)